MRASFPWLLIRNGIWSNVISLSNEDQKKIKVLDDDLQEQKELVV